MGPDHHMACCPHWWFHYLSGMHHLLRCSVGRPSEALFVQLTRSSTQGIRLNMSHCMHMLSLKASCRCMIFRFHHGFYQVGHCVPGWAPPASGPAPGRRSHHQHQRPCIDWGPEKVMVLTDSVWSSRAYFSALRPGAGLGGALSSPATTACICLILCAGEANAAALFPISGNPCILPSVPHCCHGCSCAD